MEDPGSLSDFLKESPGRAGDMSDFNGCRKQTFIVFKPLSLQGLIVTAA